MSDVMKMTCACMSVRRMARVITRMYAEEMGDLMEPTQFGLLQMIAQTPECTQAKLMRAAGYEKTTLSRDIVRMKERGWVVGGRGGVEVTEAGREMLKKTTPHWKQAQRNLRDAIGEDSWEAMMMLGEFVAQDVEGIGE